MRRYTERMSTFKRLLNVGKGKVKAATRPSRTHDDDGEADWLSDARHAAADAADQLANAIRPDTPPSGAPQSEPVAAAVEDAPPVSEEPEEPTKPTGPAKRTL